MAVNRFRNIGFNPKNIEYYADTQEEFLPDISGLAKTVSSLDDQLNQDLELPNYLRQSESDVAAFNQFRTDSEAYRQGAIEDFKAGNITKGNQKLKGYRDFLHKSKQPSGTFAELERGTAEYSNALKEITATYKDPKSKQYSPELFRLAKSRLDSGINPFKDDVGNLRTSISAPTLMDDTPRREALDYFNDYLDNITADQVVSRSQLRNVKGMSFQQLLESGKSKFIDRNKVMNVLIGAAQGNQGLQQAFEQYGLATTGQGGAGTLAVKDGKFDTSTALGSMLEGLVQSKVYKQRDIDSKVVKDIKGAEDYKSSLKKKEAKYQHELGRETLNSHVYTKGTGMADLNIDTNGKFVEDGSKFINPKTGTVGQHMTSRSNISLEEYIQTEEGLKKYPGLASITDRFPQGTMSIKEYNKMIGEKYEQKKKKLSMEDVTIKTYGASAYGKARRNALLGAAGQPLNEINYKRIIVKSAGGEPVVYENASQFMEEHDMTVEEFKKNLAIVGEIEAANATTPSGEEAIWVDPENPEDKITMVISDRSREDLAAKKGFYQLYEPLNKGSVDESGWASTGISAIDNTYGKLFLEAVDMYAEDTWNAVLSNRLSTEDDRIKAEQELEKIRKNPKLNTYSHRKGVLYRENVGGEHLEDASQRRVPLIDSNGKPITPERLLNLIEQSQANGRK